jgi:hypothetical protein
LGLITVVDDERLANWLLKNREMVQALIGPVEEEAETEKRYLKYIDKGSYFTCGRVYEIVIRDNERMVIDDTGCYVSPSFSNKWQACKADGNQL